MLHVLSPTRCHVTVTIEVSRGRLVGQHLILLLLHRMPTTAHIRLILHVWLSLPVQCFGITSRLESEASCLVQNINHERVQITRFVYCPAYSQESVVAEYQAFALRP
jgi:hypothetical protein